MNEYFMFALALSPLLLMVFFNSEIENAHPLFSFDFAGIHCRAVCNILGHASTKS
ncbi:Uncharacterised protein [Citrobacter koseri]|nr:Uncharacterised protein [Citrobacter koseri]